MIFQVLAYYYSHKTICYIFFIKSVSTFVICIHSKYNEVDTNGLNMSFLKKKNNASFVFFIITLYAFIGFGLGYIIWEYFL